MISSWNDKPFRWLKIPFQFGKQTLIILPEKLKTKAQKTLLSISNPVEDDDLTKKKQKNSWSPEFKYRPTQTSNEQDIWYLQSPPTKLSKEKTQIYFPADIQLLLTRKPLLNMQMRFATEI